MKLTGDESCSLAKGIEIWRIKSLKFDAKTLEIVKSFPKLTIADKRNRAAAQRRDQRSLTAHQNKAVNRVKTNFSAKFIVSCLKNFMYFRVQHKKQQSSAGQKTTRCSGTFVSLHTHALCSCCSLRQNERVVLVVLCRGWGHFLFSYAQINREMEGMANGWSTQRARRVK